MPKRVPDPPSDRQMYYPSYPGPALPPRTWISLGQPPFRWTPPPNPMEEQRKALNNLILNYNGLVKEQARINQAHEEVNQAQKKETAALRKQNAALRKTVRQLENKINVIQMRVLERLDFLLASRPELAQCFDEPRKARKPN